MEALPRDELKARALTRITLLTAIAIAFLTGVQSLVQAERSIEFAGPVVNFAGTVIYLFLLWGLRHGWQIVPRVVFMIVANLHLALIISGYGWARNVYLYFFVMMIVPFAILSRSQKKLITPMALLALVLLAAVFLYFKVFQMKPWVISATPEPGRLLATTITNLSLMSLAVILLMRYMRNVHFQAEDALETEHKRSEELLLNVLPAPIADRLKRGEQPIADQFEEVSILFADIVGFTELAGRTEAHELVELLNQVFSEFDELADRHGLEKIKTIGDCYMVVAGLPEPRSDHALAAARMAFDMQRALRAHSSGPLSTLRIRIGIHSGRVVAGVIGQRKFSYDLWGDAVNTASRMESHGEPGRITVTPRTFELVRAEFDGIEREAVQVKGKGPMTTWFLKERGAA